MAAKDGVTLPVDVAAAGQLRYAARVRVGAVAYWRGGQRLVMLRTRCLASGAGVYGVSPSYPTRDARGGSGRIAGRALPAGQHRVHLNLDHGQTLRNRCFFANRAARLSEGDCRRRGWAVVADGNNASDGRFPPRYGGRARAVRSRCWRRHNDEARQIAWSLGSRHGIVGDGLPSWRAARHDRNCCARSRRRRTRWSICRQFRGAITTRSHASNCR